MLKKSFDEKTRRKKWKNETNQQMQELLVVLENTSPFLAENIEIAFNQGNFNKIAIHTTTPIAAVIINMPFGLPNI